MKSIVLVSCLLAFASVTNSVASHPSKAQDRKTCTVKASGTNKTDDAPAIITAFKECGKGGKVVFTNTTYYVNSVMNTTELDDCAIDMKGTLLWSTDIQYWLNNSLPVGYQNQSSAWFLGGDKVVFDGHGYATLDGNGPYWYRYIHGQSNYHGRPHAITLSNLSNSVIRGVRFLQSQMWTMSIIHSRNVLLDNIYVNNTGRDGTKSSNTDGADTIFSHHITFNNWTVVNGDDSISLKANSTDITISNSTLINGLGIAMGSIGQYKDQYETISRVKIENIKYIGTKYAVYFKTWTGDQVNYPPNGGGGGLGSASQMNITNLSGTGFRGPPISISQCTTFSGGPAGNCTNSKFQIKDIAVRGLTGTGTSNSVASFQCSAVAPCENLAIFDAMIDNGSGTQRTGYLCGNVDGVSGFNCTGLPCVGGSSTGGCEN